MIDIGYTDFKTDCREIVGAFLDHHGFNEIPEKEEDYSIYFKNLWWTVEVSMLSNFPHVGVAVAFKSPDDTTVNYELLHKVLGIRNEDLEPIHEKYLGGNKSFASIRDEYRAEMYVSRDILSVFYKPLLIGEFTYKDYSALLKTL